MVGLALVAAPGCSSQLPAPTAVDGGESSVVGKTVGSEGGTIEHPGGVTITIPAGAVDDDVEFYVTPTEQVKGTWFSAAGTTYEVGPSGKVFKTPVTMSFPYDPALIAAGGSTADLRVFTRATPNDAWEMLTPKINADNTATVQVSHLSLFQVGKSHCGDSCPEEVKAVFAGKRYIERNTDNLEGNGCLKFLPINGMLRPETADRLSKPLDAMEKAYALKYGYRLVEAVGGCDTSEIKAKMPQWVIFNEPLTDAELKKSDGSPRMKLYVNRHHPCCVTSDPQKVTNDDDEAEGPLMDSIVE